MVGDGIHGLSDVSLNFLVQFCGGLKLVAIDEFVRTVELSEVRLTEGCSGRTEGAGGGGYNGPPPWHRYDKGVTTEACEGRRAWRGTYVREYGST